MSEAGETNDVNISVPGTEAKPVNTATQTPSNGTPPDGGNAQPGASNGTGTGSGDQVTPGEGNGAGNGNGDDINPSTGKPFTADEWRDKFRASAKGAQDLLDQNKTLASERDESKGKVTELEKRVEELTAIAEGKNPEGLKAADVQRKLAETSQELAALKERQELDAFERSEPLATGKLRDSLKALARANPGTSLQQLWDDNLKAGAVAANTAATAAAQARNAGASDTGGGTSTREPGGGGDTLKGLKGDTGITLEEFNKLSVAERGALISKYDIR